MDDYKYSLKRRVAYSHSNPGYPSEAYGSRGPERTTGVVTEVHLVEDRCPHWEYTVTNVLTGESCRVPEEAIYHGANLGYLDLYRRDDIRWSSAPPEEARVDHENNFWKTTLQEFVRTAVPQIREQEINEELQRTQGRRLPLDAGDYIKISGELRPEMEQYHNLYAKILSAAPSDIPSIHVTPSRPGLHAGDHKVLKSYRVLLDNGEEACIYDAEVKAAYTTHGRTVILNWRAATFLAEAFGDDAPYEVHVEYLNGHIFSRSELEGISPEDQGELLARLLYAKGLILLEELPAKITSLRTAPAEYLVDQILSISRFDMSKNEFVSSTEIAERRSEDARLRDLLGQ